MDFTSSLDSNESQNKSIKTAKSLCSKDDLFNTRRHTHESFTLVPILRVALAHDSVVLGKNEEDELRKRRHKLKRKQQCMLLKPKHYKNVTVKHKMKFKKLLKVWEGIQSHKHGDFGSIEEVHGNGVCFQDEFLIGRGSCGTEVYICLGFDGIERAIKRLPKHLCKKFLKNERDILTSPNAVDSPQIVNYWLYDDTTSPDFDYLILDLYEQNLEEYIKDEAKTITEYTVRKMIRQVFEGLKALHSREPRILHRDLKPSNILVDVNGDLALSDFGIGRFFPEEGISYACKLWKNIR